MVGNLARGARRRIGGARPDEGQAIVEGVLGMLLVTFAAAGILIIIIAAFSINACNAAIQSASWDISPAKVETSGDPNGVVKEALLAHCPGLDAANLTVTDAKVQSDKISESSTVTRNPTSLNLSNISSERSLAQISFKVSYELPGTGGLTVSRSVSHDLVMKTKSEVS